MAGPGVARLGPDPLADDFDELPEDIQRAFDGLDP